MTNLGQTITSLRKTKRISLKQLSEVSGLSAGQLSRIETGAHADPAADDIVKVACALGVTIEDIYEGGNFPVPTRKPIISQSSRTTFAVTMVEKAKMEALARKMRDKLGCSVRWTDILHRMIDDIDVDKAVEIFSNYLDPVKK